MNLKRLLTVLMLLLSACALATELHPPKALIDFSLIDSDAKPFHKSTLKGQWTLLFFGYATCPGICPHTLNVLKTVWTEGQLDQKLRFIFVTLNPKKDSPQNLKAFLSAFNPHFKGLTGDINTIEALSKNCSIYYFNDPASKQTMIDHSATLLLINPKAELQALFSPPHEAQKLLVELNTFIHPAGS